VSRALLETMLKLLRDPLPTGVEYVRVVDQPIRVKDTWSGLEQIQPGQDVESLTVFDPDLAELVHPFVKLTHLKLVASLLQDKMDDLFMDGEDKENGEENVAATLIESLQLLTEDQKRDKHYKTLIRRHTTSTTSLECVCWHLISTMYGFGQDGQYKQIAESAEGHSRTIESILLFGMPFLNRIH
jgi:hypothetical protein